MIATMPAKIGASKLVPPATVRFVLLESRNPFDGVQLPVFFVSAMSLEQYRNPALFGEAVKEISGTNRKFPLGIPGTPVCQVGRGVNVLTPPPPEDSVPGTVAVAAMSSFHTISGMYDFAELITSDPFAAVQNVVFVDTTSAVGNSVPPIPVTHWLLDGKSTAKACCSAVVWSVLPEQSSEPLSPSAPITDCPCAAARANVPLSAAYSPAPKSDSH